MSSITELRKKAAEKFPGYPVDFESGDRIVLKSSVNFTEDERTALESKTDAINELQDKEDARTEDLVKALVEVLAFAADKPDLAREELPHESVALLLVIFEEYQQHIQADEANGAAKSKGANSGPRTRGVRANR